jgi:hypothetical protein
MKKRPAEAELFHADGGRRDMMKPTVAFRYFAKALKNVKWDLGLCGSDYDTGDNIPAHTVHVSRKSDREPNAGSANDGVIT